jgi:proteasome lid subunit RPN8/RPN11
VIMHNHPSGDPTPSRADIEMTQAIVAVARPLGVAVHDHIIVDTDGHVEIFSQFDRCCRKTILRASASKIDSRSASNAQH